jgi:hypothetical protein
MLLLRACPRCAGALYPDRELSGGFFCLNCGAVLGQGLQLPAIVAKRAPGRPSRLAHADAGNATPTARL